MKTCRVLLNQQQLAANHSNMIPKTILDESIQKFLSTLRLNRNSILETPQLNRLKLNNETATTTGTTRNMDSEILIKSSLDDNDNNMNNVVTNRREYIENLIPKPTPSEFFQTMLREPKYYSELMDLKVIDQFCVFCNREIVEEGLIEESENFMALYNIRPVFPGHCLIIPKNHVTRFSSLPLEHAREFVEFTQLVIRALKKIHHTDSIELLIQEGPQSGQSICHLHLHLMPRSAHDMPNPEDDWMEYFSRNEHSARLLTNVERQQLAQHVKQVMKNQSL